MDLSSSKSTGSVSKRERDGSLINPGRAWWEQREACSRTSVTEGRTGEKYATENSSKLGHPTGGA